MKRVRKPIMPRIFCTTQLSDTEVDNVKLCKLFPLMHWFLNLSATVHWLVARMSCVGCKIEVNNYIVMHFLKLSLWAIFFLLHRRLEGKL